VPQAFSAEAVQLSDAQASEQKKANLSSGLCSSLFAQALSSCLRENGTSHWRLPIWQSLLGNIFEHPNAALLQLMTPTTTKFDVSAFRRAPLVSVQGYLLSQQSAGPSSTLLCACRQ
jgi:hypothetical protein